MQTFKPKEVSHAKSGIFFICFFYGVVDVLFSHLFLSNRKQTSFSRDEWHLLHLLIILRICRCSVQPFISFESKANKFLTRWVAPSSFANYFTDLSMSCSAIYFFRIESKQYRQLCRKEGRRKCFANGEAKAQIYELVDDEAKIYFTGVTRSQHVELLLFARKEWPPEPGECWGWKRSCWN